MESKCVGTPGGTLINESYIFPTRIIQSNLYLNQFNYFNRNSIKMLSIKKKIYFQKRMQMEEYKKQKTLPEVIYSENHKNTKSHEKIIVPVYRNIKDLILNKSNNIFYTEKENNRRNYKLFNDLVSLLNNKTKKNRNNLITYQKNNYSLKKNRLTTENNSISCIQNKFIQMMSFNKSITNELNENKILSNIIKKKEPIKLKKIQNVKMFSFDRYRDKKKESFYLIKIKKPKKLKEINHMNNTNSDNINTIYSNEYNDIKNITTD